MFTVTGHSQGAPTVSLYASRDLDGAAAWLSGYTKGDNWGGYTSFVITGPKRDVRVEQHREEL